MRGRRVIVDAARILALLLPVVLPIVLSIVLPSGPAAAEEGAPGGELFDLAGMTLREAAERWGTYAAMADVVKSLKLFADMQLKQQLAQII